MTDKQIKEVFNNCVYCIEPCLEIKELQAELKIKEQECEELKKQHQGDKGLITATGKMNYQLLQEYDQLKAENDELKEQLELNTANAVVIDMAQRLYKLKQTLTEIKEIIHFNKTNRLSGGACISIEQILQKISEVVDEK
jgi:hypothetical protein